MSIVCTLLLCSAVILNHIELSTQFDRPSDDATNPGHNRCEPSSSPPGRHFPSTSHSSPNPDNSARSPKTAEPPVIVRSRSYTLRQTFPSLLGFRFEDLGFIRLSPYNKPTRIFELRLYVFPPDKPLGWRTRNHVLNPLPKEEQIVLSTSEGDVYAILVKLPRRETILRAIFTPASPLPKRVKINMHSGAFQELSGEEIEGCPIPTREVIAKSYAVLRLSSQSEGSSNCSHNPLATPPDPARSQLENTPPLRVRSRSPTLRQIFPRVLGYTFDDLPSIRLIPNDFPNRIFELRRYAFPLDRPIGLRAKNNVLHPLPTGEQIVLSTSNGDICALLAKASSRSTILRPIYTFIYGITERVKINMNTGAVRGMTAAEIAECPISAKKLITKLYRVSRVETTPP